MSAKMDLLVKKLTDAMVTVSQKKSSAYDSTAIVRRIEGDTVWVHLPGGVDETPIQKTIACSPGDTVQVRVSEGRAWIQGNHSAPPTDDTTAIHARKVANNATSVAETAEETATEAQGTAVYAKETAESILVYDHSYILESDEEDPTRLKAVFTAYLYQGGIDVKNKYPSEQFNWYLKKENDAQDEYLGFGYTVTVYLDQCGYGAEVIGTFSDNEDSELLDSDGNNLADSSETPITGRSTGETVRVRDLSVTTTIFPEEKLMVVGTENEHLISMQTLQDYLNNNLDKQIKFGTTSYWNEQGTLQSEANTLYVYTDHHVVNGQNVAGIKAGDGNAYLIDIPFTDEVAMNHISDTTRHITQEEREFWNNKVSAYYAGTDQLVLTTS